jgi:hypothetical protein
LASQVVNLSQAERTIGLSGAGFCHLTMGLAWLVRWLSEFCASREAHAMIAAGCHLRNDDELALLPGDSGVLNDAVDLGDAS